METLRSKSFFEKFEGETIQLHCESKGFPHPEIYWYKDKDLVAEGVKDNGKSISTLVFENLKIGDAAKYT